MIPIAPSARRPLAARLAMSLVGLGILVAGCGNGSRRDVRPIPPAGRAPVTLGELLQLRLAVEGFDSVFDARAEEQDVLPMLAAAWATFYHRPDPDPSAEARYRFTEALCRDRLPGGGQPRELLACMDQLRDALYEDLISVTRAFRAGGYPDKQGEYRLSQLEKDFAMRRRAFAATRKQRAERRATTVLAAARRCALAQPRATVMAVGHGAVLLNGFPVVTAPEGLHRVPASEYDTLAAALESRLLESRRVGRAAGQLVLAPDRRVPAPVLGRLLRLAARLGVTRVCLKVARQGEFRVPCCLTLRLGPPGIRPSRAIEPTSGGVALVDGAERTPIPPDGPLPAGGPRGIRLGAAGAAADLARLVERLASHTKDGPELFVGGTPADAPPRRIAPAPGDPRAVPAPSPAPGGPAPGPTRTRPAPAMTPATPAGRSQP